MNDQNQAHLESARPVHLGKPVGFLDSLFRTILWPVMAPMKWLAIALPALAVTMLLSSQFPGAAVIGSPPPRIGVLFSSPFTAFTYQGWMGLGVWLVTAMVVSTALASWCLDAATQKRLSLAALFIFGISKGVHFLAGVLLISLTFAPTYLFAFAFAVVFGDGSFDIDLHEPRTYVWSLLVLGMIPAFWALLRLLILPPLVTLRGWRGSLGLAWRSTKGFAFRFFCHFIVMVALAIAFVLVVVMAGRSFDDILGLQNFMILLAGTSIFMSLLIAHWLTILMVLHIPRSVLRGDDDQIGVF
ncbi:MAG: hypothetical protein IPK59_10930 [Rhodospirillaceae bacterium]|nr:hypothetical protein [Rhodospirillaceae bacterium]